MFLRVDDLYPLFLAFCIGSQRVNAQSSTTLFAGNHPVVAYPIASTLNVATTYLLACPAGSDTSKCNFQQPYTLTQGPSTVEFAMTFNGSTTITLGCTLSGLSSMACIATQSISGSAPSIATTTVTGAAATARFRAVSIVTDSAALLTYAAAGATTTLSSATASNSTTILSEMSSASGNSSPILSSVSWSSSSPTTTGVAPKISAGAGLRIGVKGAANFGLLGVMGMIGAGALGL